MYTVIETSRGYGVGRVEEHATENGCRVSLISSESSANFV